MACQALCLHLYSLETAIIGLLTAWLGWQGRHPEADRWCPRCANDLSSTESKTCSGCGFSSTSEADFHHRHRRWGVIIIGLLVTAVSIAWCRAYRPWPGSQSTPCSCMAVGRACGSGWAMDCRSSSIQHPRPNIDARAHEGVPQRGHSVRMDGAIRISWRVFEWAQSMGTWR